MSVSSQGVQRICRNDQASLQVKLRLRGSEVRMLMASLGAESLPMFTATLGSRRHDPIVACSMATSAWNQHGMLPTFLLSYFGKGCRCQSDRMYTPADGVPQCCGHTRYAGPRARGALPNKESN